MPKRSKGQRARRKARANQQETTARQVAGSGLETADSTCTSQSLPATDVRPKRQRRPRDAGRGEAAWPGARMVIAQWPDIVGPDIAKNAVPVSCDGGVLTVRASTVVWATQLRMVSRQILAGIDLQCGDGIVSRVEVLAPASSRSNDLVGTTVGISRAEPREPQLGAVRLAARMAINLGVPVEREDVWELVNLDYLEEAGEYEGWPTYRVRDADNLCAEQRELVESVVAARVEWTESSYDEYEAREMLGGWRHEEFARVTAERGIWPIRDDRYSAADIEALAEDSELQDQIRRAQLMGPDQAAECLGIRRTDFDHCVAAAWIAPVQYVLKELRGGRRTVKVPLFRVGDVEDLLALPVVDWDAVRSAPAGAASPLVQFATRPADRAVAVRRFVDAAARRHGVEMAAAYWGYHNEWIVRWEPDANDAPDPSVIAHELAGDVDIAEFIQSIGLETGPLDDARFARGVRHRAGPSPSPLAGAPTWSELRAKLLDRLSRPGTAPGISCRDAQTLASKLRECGVAPTRLGDERSWQHSAAVRTVDLDVPDEVAMLAGRLEDCIEHRFAPNLTKREARLLLDFITVTEKGRSETRDSA